MDTDHSDIKDFLANLNFFQGFSTSEIAHIEKQSTLSNFNAGAIILEQGEKSDVFSIVYSGGVEGVYWDSYQVKHPIFKLGIGDYFCPLSLLSESPSQISFQAMDHTIMINLPGAFFIKLISQNPSIITHLTTIISKRQERLTSKLMEIKSRDESLKKLLKTIEEDASFLVGKTEFMNQLWEKIPDLAKDANPLLIRGEFGTGKEFIAQIIHSKSPLKYRPFIIIDALSISEKDWQERFWEERGEGDEGYLFSLSQSKFGFLELASGGTLLVKNVDALCPALQLKIKEFICASSGVMKGCSSPKRHKNLPRVRMLFTTRGDLIDAVEKGKFDLQLYEILNQNVIFLPPLRERKVDILDLASHFITKHSTSVKKVDRLSSRAREQLLRYEYQRGNIRELEEIIKKGIDLTSTNEIRSEHLFLGLPAGRAHIWWNPLSIKKIARMIQKDFYPEMVQWGIVAFFFFMMLSCFFGSSDSSKNWGTFLVWWVWWPFLCIAAFWIGRTWCSFCAYATIGHTVQKHFNLRLKFPKFLKDYDYMIAIIIYLFVVWVEEASGMREKPLYTGLLLVSITSIEIVLSILFERDIWCRHICPMGNLIGVFAMSSILEVRANTDICMNQCTTYECYKGTADRPGCPMFQYLRYVDNNQTCKLCLNCIKTCPHKAVSLYLRTPGCEIWESNQVRPGMAFFVLTLMAVLFPVINKSHNSHVFTALAFFATPAIMILLVWGISLISFYGVKGIAIYEGFWRSTYAYVPLALAAHIAYQIQFIPRMKKLRYSFIFSSRYLVNMGSLTHLLQGIFLSLGFLFSLYLIIRIYLRKFYNRGSPHIFYWPAHVCLMLLYPFLLWLMLGGYKF